MSSKAYFVVSGTIFGVVSAAHLVRAVYRMPVHVGDWAFPGWLSWGGSATTSVTAAWFTLCR